jgi:hypothetical protein
MSNHRWAVSSIQIRFSSTGRRRRTVPPRAWRRTCVEGWRHSNRYGAPRSANTPPGTAAPSQSHRLPVTAGCSPHTPMPPATVSPSVYGGRNSSENARVGERIGRLRVLARDRKWPLNEGHHPNFRGVRAALATRYPRVGCIGRARAALARPPESVGFACSLYHHSLSERASTCEARR